MQLEIGKIYKGKVKGITNYGAFVEIPLEGSKPVTGMVHISEVSNTYVTDIHTHLEEGQSVQVKVLNISEQGKISRSIKKALPADDKPQKSRPPRRQERDRGAAWEAKSQKPAGEMTFEDMMNRFKQNSEERMCDIRRNTDRKNGSKRRPK